MHAHLFTDTCTYTYKYTGEEVAPSIAKSRDAGIRTVMITGGLFLCLYTHIIHIHKHTHTHTHADAHIHAYIHADYVKTAKAIAINIGLLEQNAPENRAVDCALIRVCILILIFLLGCVCCVAGRFVCALCLLVCFGM